MGQRTIYVKEEHEPLWDRARELAGEDSLSAVIAEGLRYVIGQREAVQARESERGTTANLSKVSGGRIKRGEGGMIGNAGEYAVVSELLKRGIIAGLTPRNTPAFDVMATIDHHAFFLRVKTKTEETRGWQWNANPHTGEIFTNVQPEGDMVVLVDLGDKPPINRYYVVPTQKIETWMKADYDQWVAAPSKDPNKPHDPNNRRRIMNFVEYAERLRPFEGIDTLLDGGGA